MNGVGQAVLPVCSVAAVIAGGLIGQGRGDDAQPRNIPPALAPLEYLVGQWKGSALPKNNPAQQFRGWPERHSWAWFFAQGKPAGLTFTIEGNKYLASGKLTFDPQRKRYRLEGTEPKPSKRAVVLEGTLDSTGTILGLEPAPSGASSKTSDRKLRVSLRPNANFVRYTMTEDIQEPGAVQYVHMVQINLGKDGESFAGTAAAADRPKCIVTGGTATITISFQGRSIPLCCTGCADEFNSDPPKYLKKAALMLGTPGGKKTNQPAASRVSRSEDAFAGDVVDDQEKSPPTRDAKKNSTTAGEADAKAETTQVPVNSKGKSATKKPADNTPTRAARAATLLRLGRSLEKSGKTKRAIAYFRQIVKEYADTPAAKTAGERIKALEKD
jgi:hypothetical protein